ncbi:MAG: succinyl-diaminopimelate desuccinylase [Proteobacteria bacterium]|nr:succinyl-diaminopimelate desuccinylase [Pseudomonadota bacterium]MDA0960797.1 succinyl-diaminopimelate desuccinylase [Pseudomonadota bacterium]MDA1152148.1 succinyl-diaminopimelate desuccinylase [Pseudomonadota bacterium]
MSSYAIQLAQKLVRCPSVTPAEGGALDLLQDELGKLGFDCKRLPFGDGEKRIDNLFARRGTDGPHFAFAGHTDVVPVGDITKWQHDPFIGALVDGKLYGRGAADMKGGVAAFVAAVAMFDATEQAGSISLIITGDEEGDADFGTVKMVEWLKANEQVPDVCVVGEPTNPVCLGDVIKNGRRGSLSCHLRVDGVQGHVAYPHLADNPITRLLAMLAPVNGTALDGGNDYFDPSTANVTSIDTSNDAGNVIPATVEARFNIRFNTEHKSEDLIGWLEEHFDRVGGQWTANWRVSALPFVTPAGRLTELMQGAILSVTGQTPALSTSGGTSDARFITTICPVAEFGLVSQTMHQVDEHVDAADIDLLAKIYHQMLVRFFEGEV